MPPPRIVSVVAIAGLLLGTTACGTRVKREAESGALLGSGPASAAVPVVGPAEPGRTGDATPAVPTTPSRSGTTSVPGVSTPGASGGSLPRPTTGSPSGGSGASGGASGASSAATAPTGPSPATPAGPRPATPAPRSPILLASVGSYSGIAGATLIPILQGTQLWVKHINGRGGLDGHPVKLLVFDDSGDPAKHRAQVQQAVEQHKAIAFITNGETLTGRGSVDYITEKRVPVIGGDTATPWYYDSPMYFPQASSGDSVMLTAIASAAQQLVPRGRKKLATITCQEAQACADADRVFSANAGPVGFEYVYRGKSSIAQPDFTAECLAARNAGAESLLMTMDLNSVSRIVASCARQGFRPTYAVVSSLADEKQKTDPNFDGMVAASTVFPYFRSDIPAAQEFQEARATLGGGLTIGISLATGWVSGKLLERAAVQLPEPPTSAAILAGLWALREDTLGGLTMPITFIENRPPPPLACWWNITIRDKAWVSPDGFVQHCRR